jgi:hypothetical protein
MSLEAVECGAVISVAVDERDALDAELDERVRLVVVRVGEALDAVVLDVTCAEDVEDEVSCCSELVDVTSSDVVVSESEVVGVAVFRVELVVVRVVVGVVVGVVVVPVVVVVVPPHPVPTVMAGERAESELRRPLLSTWS